MICMETIKKVLWGVWAVFLAIILPILLFALVLWFIINVYGIWSFPMYIFYGVLFFLNLNFKSNTIYVDREGNPLPKKEQKEWKKKIK